MNGRAVTGITPPWLSPPAAAALASAGGANPTLSPPARVERAQRRALLVLVVLSLGLLVWLEGLVLLTHHFARMFKEVMGDEPLPAITQIVIGLANRWLHELRWCVLGPMGLGATLLAWHWRRRVRVASDWRRVCHWLSQPALAAAPVELAPSATPTVPWPQLREPWVQTWARYYLGPPAALPMAPPTLPSWAAPPGPIALLLARQAGWPSANEWAATSRLLDDNEASNPANLAWLPVFLCFSLLGVVLVSALAVLSYLTPFFKVITDICHCGG